MECGRKVVSNQKFLLGEFIHYKGFTFSYEAFMTLWDTHEHENVFSEQSREKEWGKY
jgi:hypothetical protein